MSDQKVNNAEEKTGGDPKIDAIKQLIFGENIAEYDKRFESVLLELQETKLALENKIQELDQKTNNKIDTSRTELDNVISLLDEKLEKYNTQLNDNKVDRRSLGKMLQSIGETLQQ